MAEPVSKGWWKSTTVWINLVGIVAIVLDLVIKTNIIPDPDIIAIVVAILNILNRLRAPSVIQPLKLT